LGSPTNKIVFRNSKCYVRGELGYMEKDLVLRPTFAVQYSKIWEPELEHQFLLYHRARPLLDYVDCRRKVTETN
jgi:hypothetical protein